MINSKKIRFYKLIITLYLYTIVLPIGQLLLQYINHVIHLVLLKIQNVRLNLNSYSNKNIVLGWNWFFLSDGI